MRAVIVLLLGYFSIVQGEIPEHRVSHLPGYPGPLRTRNWSGYIPVSLTDSRNVGKVAHVHYWFIKSENEKPDAEIPTILWEQGGPGGSSLIALLTENGPFTLNDESLKNTKLQEDGSMVPHVYDNPNSWHTQANMLYINHPAPTGYSYCTKEGDETVEADCEWEDYSQAELSYNFLVKFFYHFPEFRKNPFHLSGESYAGVLAPTLALEILKHRSVENRHLAPWSVEGMILGNAVPGSKILTATPYSGWLGAQVAVDFRYGHGMISEDRYKAIYDACEGYWGKFDPPANDKCLELLEDPIRPVISQTGDTDLMGGGYFLYDNCDPDLSVLRVKQGAMVEHEAVRDEALLRAKELSAMRQVGSESIKVLHEERENNNAPTNSGLYSCGQERVGLIWLNLPTVQKALNVKKTSFTFVTDLKYEHNIDSLVETYKTTLIPHLRVWQYSGDADPCVPYVGTQRWIDSLDLPLSHPWRPWTVNNQVSGYTKTYSMDLSEYVSPFEGTGTRQTSNITLVTIKAAGHMVPRYKPQQSLHMVTAYLQNKLP